MEKNNFYRESDLKIIALLLASEEVNYIGAVLDNKNRVWCRFSPEDVALELVEAYFQKTELSIHPFDLLEAFEKARTTIFRTREDTERSNLLKINN